MQARIVETRRGVGTFVRANGADAASRPDRERRLNALGDRFLAEAAALGFPADRAIEHLRRRAEREVQR